MRKKLAVFAYVGLVASQLFGEFKCFTPTSDLEWETVGEGVVGMLVFLEKCKGQISQKHAKELLLNYPTKKMVKEETMRVEHVTNQHNHELLHFTIFAKSTLLSDGNRQ